MTLLEDLPHFSLWHDPNCACLYATWRGRHPGYLTRMQYNLIYWHLCATGSKHLLNDSLLDEDGWQEAADWVANEGFARLAQQGLQVVAWVLPQHTGAFYDTIKIISHLREPRVDTFADAQAAYDWLHRQYWAERPAATTPLPSPLTVAAFLALPHAEQLRLIDQQGRAQVPRWEADYYVQPYQLPTELLVELCYHAHSGVLYRVRARSLTS